MDNSLLFKAVLDADKMPVVICDLSHTIVYMNRAAAENYKKYGGFDLLGQSILDCHNEKSREMIKKVVAWFNASENHNLVYTFKNTKLNKDVYMVALRDEDGKLIGYYEKHEMRNNETMKMYGMEDN